MDVISAWSLFAVHPHAAEDDFDPVAVKLLGHLVVAEEGPARLLAHVLDIVGLIYQRRPDGGICTLIYITFILNDRGVGSPVSIPTVIFTFRVSG